MLNLSSIQWQVVATYASALGTCFSAIAAALAWRAAARATSVSERADQRYVEQLRFLEYERYVIAHAQASADAKVLIAQCDHSERALLGKAVMTGNMGNSRYIALIAEIDDVRQATAVVELFLNSDDQLALVNDFDGKSALATFRNFRIAIDRSRTSLQADREKIALLSKSWSDSGATA